MIAAKAQVKNGGGEHSVVLITNDHAHSITIPPRDSGGSSANGAELLFLALATCYCNDIYREAAKRGIAVKSVRVEVDGTFDAAPGSVAQDITYSATVEADATEEATIELMKHTDTVAEIHNTLRMGTTVTLKSMTAVPSGPAGL
jgi:uncharacterized OsmC-like protein